MGLLQNISIYNSNPVCHGAGSDQATPPAVPVSGCVDRACFNRAEQFMNKFISAANIYVPKGSPVVNEGQIQKSGVPNGYAHPYQLIMPMKGGGMSTYKSIKGTGDSTAILGLGKNLAAPTQIVGRGVLSGNMSILAQLVATGAHALIGLGTLSGKMNMSLSLVANLAGNGAVTTSLSLIAWMISNILGSGTTAGSVLHGTANMGADITSEGDLVTAKTCAIAVWEALAAEHNNPGTMGKDMNSAASAGDPWSSLLANYSDPATFGEFVKKLLTTAKYLGMS